MFVRVGLQYREAGYGRVLTRLVSGDPVPIATPQSTDTDEEEQGQNEQQEWVCLLGYSTGYGRVW